MLSCTLPFSVAGCNTSLFATVDASSAAGEEVLRSARETLLHNTAMHASALKHVLSSLPQIVSIYSATLLVCGGGSGNKNKLSI